jgi:hypothetical protein
MKTKKCSFEQKLDRMELYFKDFVRDVKEEVLCEFDDDEEEEEVDLVTKLGMAVKLRLAKYKKGEATEEVEDSSDNDSSDEEQHSTPGFDLLCKAIEDRFPNAKFVVSMFKTIEEIDTKVLTDADEIIYADEYTITEYGLKTKLGWKETARYNDYFIVRKREGQTHIRYCDVIDTLIEKDFDRKCCNHKFMESIGKLEGEDFKKRNANSIPVYGSFWGS